jgi:hypothetical protein
MTTAKQKLIEIFKNNPGIKNREAADLAGCSDKYVSNVKAWIKNGMPALTYGSGRKHNSQLSQNKEAWRTLPVLQEEITGHKDQVSRPPGARTCVEDKKYNRIRPRFDEIRRTYIQRRVEKNFVPIDIETKGLTYVGKLGKCATCHVGQATTMQRRGKMWEPYCDHCKQRAVKKIVANILKNP